MDKQKLIDACNRAIKAGDEIEEQSKRVGLNESFVVGMLENREIARIALSALESPPAARRVPELTDKQCLEFLSVAFRHNKISGDICMDDIRLGVKFDLAAAPSKEDA